MPKGTTVIAVDRGPASRFIPEAGGPYWAGAHDTWAVTLHGRFHFQCAPRAPDTVCADVVTALVLVDTVTGEVLTTRLPAPWYRSSAPPGGAG